MTSGMPIRVDNDMYELLKQQAELEDRTIKKVLNRHLRKTLQEYNKHSPAQTPLDNTENITGEK